MHTPRRAVGALVMLLACGGTTLPLVTSDASTADANDATTAKDASTPDADATIAPCGAGQVLCGSTCFPNDVDHCGPTCATCVAPANATATCDGTSCGFTCNALKCGSACVDPSTDSKNCGACGHDCLTEQCVGGACVPENIFPNALAYALAVDSKNLYWNGPALKEIDQGPKGGGNWTAIASNITVARDGLAVDATKVYWPTPGGIGFVPIGGGTTGELPAHAAYPCVPALGSQFVYYGDYFNASSLYGAPYDGGVSTALEPTQGFVAGAAYAPPFVYFAVWGGAPPGMLWRASAIAADAGLQEVFAHGTFSGDPPFALDDGGTAYVPMQDGVWAVPLDGGPPANITTNAPAIVRIAVDSTHVYEASTDTIYRTPIGSTSTTMVFKAQAAGIDALAVDDAYLYWSYIGASGTGVYRMAK